MAARWSALAAIPGGGYRIGPMRGTCIVIGLLGLGWFAAGTADAQIRRTKKKEQVYLTPRDARAAALNRSSVTEKEFQDYVWNSAHDTMPLDVLIRKDVRRSEETPFWSRYSVWADATIPWRSAEFGAGKLAAESLQRPGLEDREAASKLPESDFVAKDPVNAIYAAVYRHFFDYRARGFGKDGRAKNDELRVHNPNLKDVYFIGLGPHITNVPDSLIAALQNDPNLVRDKVELRPLAKVLEVTAEAIRDRDTGAYGPAFRVDEVGPETDGEVKVTATFTEREGFWFTRELTLRRGTTGAWEVASDGDYALR
jgi:hypothetical protein